MLGISFAWLLPSCFAGQVMKEAGPYLAHLEEGGPSLKKSLPQSLADASSWTEWVWFRSDNLSSDSLIAGSGDPNSSYSRYFEVRNGRPGVRFSAESSLLASSCLRSGAWHMMAVTEAASNDPRFKHSRISPKIISRRCCVRRFSVLDGWWGHQRAASYVVPAYE
jgi:hypothetical protein